MIDLVLWCLLAAAVIGSLFAVLFGLRWLIVKAWCSGFGHSWPDEPDTDHLTAEETQKCLSCGAERQIVPSAPCSCRDPWEDHLLETEGGACAHFPCGCESYQPVPGGPTR